MNNNYLISAINDDFNYLCHHGVKGQRKGKHDPNKRWQPQAKYAEGKEDPNAVDLDYNTLQEQNTGTATKKVKRASTGTPAPRRDHVAEAADDSVTVGKKRNKRVAEAADDSVTGGFTSKDEGSMFTSKPLRKKRNKRVAEAADDSVTGGFTSKDEDPMFTSDVGQYLINEKDSMFTSKPLRRKKNRRVAEAADDSVTGGFDSGSRETTKKDPMMIKDNFGSKKVDKDKKEKTQSNESKRMADAVTMSTQIANLFEKYPPSTPGKPSPKFVKEFEKYMRRIQNA